MEEEFIDLETSLRVAHFRNACKNSSYFSCAVDCFLELTFRLFLPEIQAKLQDHDQLSDFFNLLIITGSMEIEVENNHLTNNAFELLDEIREPIWTKIIEHCHTLSYVLVFSIMIEEILGDFGNDGRVFFVLIAIEIINTFDQINESIYEKRYFRFIFDRGNWNAAVM